MAPTHPKNTLNIANNALKKHNKSRCLRYLDFHQILRYHNKDVLAIFADQLSTNIFSIIEGD